MHGTYIKPVSEKEARISLAIVINCIIYLRYTLQLELIINVNTSYILLST